MIEQLMGLESIYQAFELASSELAKQLAVPLCVPGCGKCCETVLAHRIEAIFAISASIGEGKLEKLTEFTEGWLLEKHSCAPSYEGPKFGELKPAILGEFFALSQIPCPFLLSDKTCLIYRGRPLVCRAYGVTHIAGPTLDHCQRPLGKGESKIVRAWLPLPELKKLINDYFQTLPDEDWKVTGYLPVAIFKLLKPEKYRAYIADNRIASAKLIGLPHQYPGVLWQEDLFKGVPALVPVASGKE